MARRNSRPVHCDVPSDSNQIEPTFEPPNHPPLRHSNWWKRVPKCFTVPCPLVKGPMSASLADPLVQRYRQKRASHLAKTLEALAVELQLNPRDKDFEHDLLMRVLELFPAFAVLREMRGSKQVTKDQQSVARRKRRERAAALVAADK